MNLFDPANSLSTLRDLMQLKRSLGFTLLDCLVVLRDALVSIETVERIERNASTMIPGM